MSTENVAPKYTDKNVVLYNDMEYILLSQFVTQNTTVGPSTGKLKTKTQKQKHKAKNKQNKTNSHWFKTNLSNHLFLP